MGNGPRLLGIDDAPFRKGQPHAVPIVGVLMAGSIRVEGVMVCRFPPDGDGATGFLADWIGTSRWSDGLHGVVLGGISIAGLGVIDIPELAGHLGVPVLSVTRREPRPESLVRALRKAGVPERIPIVERSPPSRRVDDGLWLGSAGAEDARCDELVRATLQQARLPEPLRIAHLIGAALVTGESKGRV